MKKAFAFVVIVISFIFTSCNASHPHATTSEDTVSTTAVIEPVTEEAITPPKVIEETENYRISSIEETSEGYMKYHYSIFDDNGKIMAEDDYFKYPDIMYVNKNIVQIDFGAGNASTYRFFDVKKNRTSPRYENPTLVENSRSAMIENDNIVYMEYDGSKIKLVISDVFDKNKYYKEYFRNFSPAATPYSDLIGAKFIDSNKLQVTYLTGNEYKKVTETMKLN